MQLSDLSKKWKGGRAFVRPGIGDLLADAIVKEDVRNPRVDPQFTQDITIGEEVPTPRGATLDTLSVQEQPISQPRTTLSEIERRQAKDFKGVDKDRTRGIGDIFKAAGLSALQGLASAPAGSSLGSMIGRGLGGAAGGGIAGAIDPTTDERLGNEIALSNLYGKYQQERGVRDAELARKAKEAQIADIERRPQKEADNRQAKFDMEAQKQLNRLGVLAEKKRLEDKTFDKMVTLNGKVYEQYKDGRRVPVIGPDGQQEVDLLDAPVEQIVNGKPVYVKGRDILNNDSMTKYRDAMLSLGRDRFEETKRSNRVREGLAQQQFDFAKTKWNETVNMRQQAMQDKAAAEAAGNVQAAANAAQRMKEADDRLNNWKVNWKSKIGTGGFTQEDYDELTN